MLVSVSASPTPEYASDTTLVDMAEMDDFAEMEVEAILGAHVEGEGSWGMEPKAKTPPPHTNQDTKRQSPRTPGFASTSPHMTRSRKSKEKSGN